MATFQVATSSPFNFAKPEEWPKWLKHFERFHQASELHKKSEESQINTLLYSMGEKADDILQSFNLQEEELKKYETVVDKFHNTSSVKGTSYLKELSLILTNKRREKQLTLTLWIWAIARQTNS